jgi:chemotaxis signal transduction protein
LRPDADTERQPQTAAPVKESVNALKERAARALEALDSTSAEDQRGLLDRRARDIARPLTDELEHELLIDVVVFEIGAGVYAIATTHARHIIRVNSLAPIPGQNGTLRGVCVYAGEIIPVFDIAALLGETDHSSEDADWALLLGEETLEAAVLVDRIRSVRSIRAAQLERLPRAALQNEAGKFIDGTLADGLTLIDAQRLLEHECMNVAR